MKLDGLGSVQAYDQDKDVIAVQSLAPLKTRAKDDQGKTYWVYPIEEQLKKSTLLKSGHQFH